MGEICEKEVYVMRDMKKNVYVMWEICEKEVYVMRDMKKNVYVMGERGYLSRTSRPRNAFSPPHPLRWKTGNAFYLKHKNSLIINHLFKLLIINVLL